jgi:hypothetical protein
MIYVSHNPHVFFLWPALAFGVDLDDRPFMEVALMFWAIGIGNKPEYM